MHRGPQSYAQRSMEKSSVNLCVDLRGALCNLFSLMLNPEKGCILGTCYMGGTIEHIRKTHRPIVLNKIGHNDQVFFKSTENRRILVAGCRKSKIENRQSTIIYRSGKYNLPYHRKQTTTHPARPAHRPAGPMASRPAASLKQKPRKQSAGFP